MAPTKTKVNAFLLYSSSNPSIFKVSARASFARQCQTPRVHSRDPKDQSSGRADERFGSTFKHNAELRDVYTMLFARNLSFSSPTVLVTVKDICPKRWYIITFPRNEEDTLTRTLECSRRKVEPETSTSSRVSLIINSAASSLVNHK
jgi:hypothetical protein